MKRSHKQAEFMSKILGSISVPYDPKAAGDLPSIKLAALVKVETQLLTVIMAGRFSMEKGNALNQELVRRGTMPLEKLGEDILVDAPLQLKKELAHVYQETGLAKDQEQADNWAREYVNNCVAEVRRRFEEKERKERGR